MNTPEITNEKFYDEEIAPILMELARKCEDHGISFVASVEYNKGEIGETYTLQHPGIKMLTAYWGMKCHGNIDNFIMVALKHAKEHEHSSIFLSLIEKEFERELS